MDRKSKIINILVMVIVILAIGICVLSSYYHFRAIDNIINFKVMYG